MPHPLLPAGTRVVLQSNRFVRQGEISHHHWYSAFATIVEGRHMPETNEYRIRRLDGTEQWVRDWDFTKPDEPNYARNAEVWQYETDRVQYRGYFGLAASKFAHPALRPMRMGFYLCSFDLHDGLYGEAPGLHDSINHVLLLELADFLRQACVGDYRVLTSLFSSDFECVTPLGERVRALAPKLLSCRLYHSATTQVLETFARLAPRQHELTAEDRGDLAEVVALMLTGIETMKTGRCALSVEPHQNRLTDLVEGRLSWTEVDAWRLNLHQQFEQSTFDTEIADDADEWEANRLLQDTRRDQAVNEPSGW